jgi:C-terminal processing protease CtpA/Prc
MTLAAIVLTGAVATAGAATWRLMGQGCRDRVHAPLTGFTYSGIGVELEQRGEQFVVHRVFLDTPADGAIYPGARLVAAEGQTPETMEGWTTLIRGEPGTEVNIDVAYGCGGQQTLTLERALIHVRY